MSGKRAYWKWLAASAGIGLFITNCTIKSATDDGAAGANTGPCAAGTKVTGCKCADNSIGSQSCLADGSYDACVCATSSGGSAGNSSTTTGGTTNGGVGGSAPGGTGGSATTSAGAGGEAGTGEIDPTDCAACLAKLCPTEWQACENDPTCLSTNTDGSGQYERIISCVDAERASGLVKRDVVRGCGVTIGVSADPDLISEWAPEGMAPSTTNLLNCMADAPGAAPASWANDDANYPLDAQMVPQPAPWASGTCAKLACTSQITN